jgi:ribosome biogenesis GTPase
MSKKKLSKQQLQRISQKQQAYADKDVLQGLVITRGKSQALVESLHDQQEIVCKVRADIDSLVVGDIVYWQQESATEGVIVAVCPRKTALGRYDRYHQYKVLAANITQMIVVIAPKPEPSTLLLDSYLVAAACIGVKLSIVFNKTDLDDEKHSLESYFRDLYQELCEHFITNSQKHPNLKGLAEILESEQSVFVGQSGVGKSSIINLILPQKQLATLPLNAIHELGQHTTSNATLYHLPYGGAIIDSPGVRAFSLSHLKQSDLLWGFAEFRPFIGHCKFRDCDHIKAPHCAILEAIDQGKIAERRYENYVKLLAQFVL